MARRCGEGKLSGNIWAMNKQHILDEIRRTAKENKSVPLGKGRFLRETGIKDSDWAGNSGCDGVMRFGKPDSRLTK
jgi:hypothetical protein